MTHVLSSTRSLMRRARIKGLISHGCHLPKKGLNSCNGRHLRALGQPVFDFLFHHNLWPCFTASLALLLLVGFSSIPRSNTRGSLSSRATAFPSVPMHLLSSHPIWFLMPFIPLVSAFHPPPTPPDSFICALPSVSLILSSATNLHVFYDPPPP